MIELSVSEKKKWSSLLARTHAVILYIWIWIFDFGPEKLPGLSRNGPLAFRQKFMLSLLRLERKQKKILQIHLEFEHFFFVLTHGSFGIETMLIRSYTPVVPSKTIPDSRPKWAKCIPVFRPKRRKTPTRWGGTYLYSWHKGVPPSRLVLMKLGIVHKACECRSISGHRNLKETAL